MADVTERAVDALGRIKEAMDELQALGVIRSQRLVGDLGEWVVAALWSGELARSKVESEWDVRTADERISVKSHAKAESNSARRTKLKSLSGKFDSVVVVVFSPGYRIKELYKVPATELPRIAERAGDSFRLPWNRLKPWRCTKADFPDAGPIVNLFEP